jgi:hypothetical protein
MWFGAAFFGGLALAVVALIVAGSDDSPTAEPLAVSTTVVATSPPEVDESAELPSTTMTQELSSDSRPAGLVAAPLPHPDVDRWCEDQFGDGASSSSVTDTSVDLQCVDPEGAAIGESLEIDDICSAQVDPGSRAVAVDPTVGGWRCTPVDPVEFGAPDITAECIDRYGNEAVAALYADDSFGWRCATKLNDIFSYRDVDMNAACRIGYGGELYAERLNDTAEGWLCLGAVTSSS